MPSARSVTDPFPGPPPPVAPRDPERARGTNRSPRRVPARAVAFFWAAAASSPAAAAPGEWRVAAEAGPWWTAGERARAGVLGGATAWYGLGEFVWATGSVQSGWVEAPAQALVEAQVGVVAALDVVRWVPYGELTVGVTGRADAVDIVPAPRLGLGVDFLLDPTWAVGAVVRGRPLFDRGPEDFAATVQLHLAARFGF